MAESHPPIETYDVWVEMFNRSYSRSKAKRLEKTMAGWEAKFSDLTFTDGMKNKELKSELEAVKTSIVEIDYHAMLQKKLRILETKARVESSKCTISKISIKGKRLRREMEMVRFEMSGEECALSRMKILKTELKDLEAQFLKMTHEYEDPDLKLLFRNTKRVFLEIQYHSLLRKMKCVIETKEIVASYSSGPSNSIESSRKPVRKRNTGRRTKTNNVELIDLAEESVEREVEMMEERYVRFMLPKQSSRRTVSKHGRK